MEKGEKNKEKLRKFADELGVDLFGIADITSVREEFNLAPELSRQFHFGLSFGKNLIHSILEDIKDHPTPLYFHHYRQLNYFLDRTAFLVSSFIQDFGYKALPIPASQIVDWERQRGHLSHKKIGFLAALGWVGRNNLLVSPILGAQFRLVSVLTDMPLKPDEPMGSDCGSCVACLSCCPAGAIKMDKADFDHHACFEKIKEFRRLGLVSQYICGICVRACQPQK